MIDLSIGCSFKKTRINLDKTYLEIGGGAGKMFKIKHQIPMLLPIFFLRDTNVIPEL